MILTEDGLHWFRVLHDAHADTGGECTTYRCVEHRRLTWIVQRATRDLDDVSAYHVEGLLNYYSTAAEAIDAMKANPCS